MNKGGKYLSKVNENAQKLANAIEKSEEFVNVKDAYEKVMADETSKALFDKFRQTQVTLQEKQMQGVQITEAEAQEANDVATEIQQNESISHLIETEQVLHDKIGEISQIITAPLEGLYASTT